MTTPRFILSGQGGAVDLNDGVLQDLGYLAAYNGLMEPAIVAKGSTVETFDGPVRLRSQATHYRPRLFTLDWCALIAGNGLAELQTRAHDFASYVEGRPSELQVGSLYLDVELDPIKYKQRLESTKRLEFSLSGEAIPATYKGKYGYAVGVAQSVAVIDDRLDRTELKLGSGTNAMVDVTGNGRVFTAYNPGSAPCNLPLIVSGLTASTTYYLKNVDQRTPNAVVFSTVSGQTTFFLSASYGVRCFPGTNTFRLQSDASGTLVTTGTYKWAIPGYPSPWRWLGNDNDRFNEGPAILTLYRRGGASYNSAANTHASAVDMQPRIGLPNEAATAYSAAKAGLVLEGSTTNILTSNQATGTDTSAATTGFASADTGPTLLAGSPTLTSSTGQFYQGSRSLGVDTTNSPANQGWCTTALSASANTVYYVQMRVKHASGSTALQAFVRDYTNGVQTLQTITPTGGWDYVKLTITTGASAVTDLRIGVRCTAAAVSTFYSDAIQVEAKPFPTSWVDGTRNADQCAVHLPHNYLKDSRDLTQTRSWTTFLATTARTGTAADGTATATTVTMASAGDRIGQVFTPDVRPKDSPWTVVVAMRLGTAASSDKLLLALRDQGGTAFGSGMLINGSDLSASETRTFALTVQASDIGATATGIEARLTGDTIGASGTWIVEAMGVFKGAFPGPIPLTENSSVPLPQQGWQWLTSMTQNGSIRFDAVLPLISTGITYYTFGDSTFGIQRHTSAGTGSNELRVIKTANGGVQTVTVANATNVWDGAKHTFKIEWLNYTSGGTQYMYLRLYVDGVLKSTDSNLVTASVTEWSTPERLLVSGGDVYATILNL